MKNRSDYAGTRVRILSENAAKIDHRSDLKLNAGCCILNQTFKDIQRQVFASIHGVLQNGLNGERLKKTNDLALRWLLTHAGRQAWNFRIGNNNAQWESIMGHYFQNIGYYAELVMAERILIEALRLGPDKTSIRDVMLADPFADKRLKMDMLVHEKLPNGMMHWGVQLTIRNHVRGKLGELHGIQIHDRHFFDDKLHPNVGALLRHHTVVLSIPQFNASPTELKARFNRMKTGEMKYQSKLQCEHDPLFGQYGKIFMRLLEKFAEGVKDRFIQIPTSRTRGIVQNSIVCTSGQDFIVIEVTGLNTPFPEVLMHYRARHTSPASWQEEGEKIMTLGIPIGGDFLDFYRDMAGVPSV